MQLGQLPIDGTTDGAILQNFKPKQYGDEIECVVEAIFTWDRSVVDTIC